MYNRVVFHPYQNCCGVQEIGGHPVPLTIQLLKFPHIYGGKTYTNMNEVLRDWFARVVTKTARFADPSRGDIVCEVASWAIPDDWKQYVVSMLHSDAAVGYEGEEFKFVQGLVHLVQKEDDGGTSQIQQDSIDLYKKYFNIEVEYTFKNANSGNYVTTLIFNGPKTVG